MTKITLDSIGQHLSAFPEKGDPKPWIKDYISAIAKAAPELAKAVKEVCLQVADEDARDAEMDAEDFEKFTESPENKLHEMKTLCFCKVSHFITRIFAFKQKCEEALREAKEDLAYFNENQPKLAERIEEYEEQMKAFLDEDQLKMLKRDDQKLVESSQDKKKSYEFAIAENLAFISAISEDLPLALEHQLASFERRVRKSQKVEMSLNFWDHKEDEGEHPPLAFVGVPSLYVKGKKRSSYSGLRRKQEYYFSREKDLESIRLGYKKRRDEDEILLEQYSTVKLDSDYLYFLSSLEEVPNWRMNIGSRVGSQEINIEQEYTLASILFEENKIKNLKFVNKTLF